VVVRRLIVAAALSLCGALLLCGEVIPNWPAPATSSPSRFAGRMTTMDVTNPLPFVGLAPCRLLDTRGNGFTGAYGPPALAAGVTRSFPLAGQVTHIGLSGIAIKTSKDVEFFYTVSGVRRAYPAWDPSQENGKFVSEGPNARLPAYLSPNERQRLIDNGT
jgi:hypothetical protein